MSFAQATVGKGLSVSHGGDDNLFVEFYNNPEYQAAFVRIKIPGDKTTEIDRRVKDTDKDRWPKQWEAFEKGSEQIGAGGTPLENCPFLNQARITALHASNVWTVEQLANLNDGNIGKIGMDGRRIQKMAQEFVQERQAPKRVVELEEQLAALQKQVASMGEKRRPGRPKKEESLDAS